MVDLGDLVDLVDLGGLDKSGKFLDISNLLRLFHMVARILVLLIVCITVSYGQNIGDTNWKTEQDFRNSEKDVAGSIIWLEQNPFASESNDTKAITSYVLNWITNAPHVFVNNDNLFTLGIVNNKKYKYAEKFRVTYLFGKTIYAINHQEQPDEVEATIRGLEGMINVYEEIIIVDQGGIHHDLENYRQLHHSNRLEEYVRQQMKNSGI